MLTSERPAHILIVDDLELNLDLLGKILVKANFTIHTADNGINAIKQVKSNPPQLILLDAMMPELSGFETCRLLKKDPETRDIPIIFITALTDIENKVKAFKLGANDYITKPFAKAELLARIECQLQLSKLRQTLERQNYLFKTEIDRKYEAELSLLEANESLVAQIENRKKIGLQLQAEIVERKQAESRLKKSLKEKDLLIKEIHHRVKNNLFIVSSLLETQADYTDDPQVTKFLEDSQNRIMSMALIHEQLHGNTGLHSIDFKEYLTTLTEQLINSCLTKEINLKTNIQPCQINIETAHPCGLIVNELIANAVEHAFPKQNQGNIILNFSKDRLGNFNLLLKDDGIGFPDHKNFYNSDSLGLELVITLVEQLEGNINMNNNNGTEIAIAFKELDYKARF